MTVFTGARLGLSWNFQPGDSGWGPSFNLQARMIDALLCAVLISDSTVASPSAPVEGDAYYVPLGATGDWFGHDGEIASFQGGDWQFYTIPNGFRARITDRSNFFWWSGSAWSAEVTSSAPVTSVAGHTGAVTLAVGDISGAAPLSSPGFLGTPTAPNQAALSRNQLLANTKYVDDAVGAATGGSRVTSVAGRTGAVTLTHSDVTDWSATLTAYVDTRVTSLINAAPAALDTLGEIAVQLASDESAASALTTAVAGKVSLAGGTMTGALGLFAGSTITTPAGSDNSTNVTNTSWVRSYVASLGYASSGALGTASTHAATDFKAAGAAETWATLPAEAQNLPLPFIIAGKPSASQVFNLIMVMAVTLPANFGGTLSYQNTQATASAAFTVNKISAGVTTAIGTITLGTASKTAITLSTQAQVSFAAGDVLQLVAPGPQDATMADIGITILAAKV